MKQLLHLLFLTCILYITSCQNDNKSESKGKSFICLEVDDSILNIKDISNDQLEVLVHYLLKEKKKRNEENLKNYTFPKSGFSNPIDLSNARRLTTNFETASGCLGGPDCDNLVKSVYFSYDSMVGIWNRIPSDILNNRQKGYRVYFAKYSDSELNPEYAGKNTVIIRTTLDSVDIDYPPNNVYNVAFNFGELCPRNCPEALRNNYGRYMNR